MAVSFKKPTLAQRFAPLFRGFDLPLLLVVALLAFVGSVSVARYIGGMLVAAETPADATPSDADLAGRPEGTP